MGKRQNKKTKESVISSDKSFQVGLKLNPKISLGKTFLNLGAQYDDQGEHDLAIEAYKKAIEVEPTLDNAYKFLGIRMVVKGKPEKAVEYFKKGIELKPDLVAYYNLGAAYQEIDNLNEAVKAYEKALKIDPTHSKTLNNLGGIYVKLGWQDKSVKMCEKAVKNDSKSARAYNNLGVAYKNVFEYDKSMKALKKAAKLDPDFAGVYYNMGIVYEEQGKVEDAVKVLKKASELDPEYSESRSFLLMRQKDICDWDGVEETSKILDRQTKEQLKNNEFVGELPYVNMFRTDDAKQNKDAAGTRGSKLSYEVRTAGVKFDLGSKERKKRRGDRRLKVGYLSYDFRSHPLGQQLADLFELHNRDRVEVRAYSYGSNDGSDLRKKFEKTADEFIDLEKVDHYSVAKKINDDKVDVLVDLMGYTRGSRYEILTFKPAPVQVNWLGYPGSTGLNHLDYIIGDEIMMPLSDQKYYGEKIVQLPHCYSMASIPEMGGVKFMREDFGLPKDGMVYTTYNASRKIERWMFDVWLNVIERVPGSVLWIWEKNSIAMKNMKDHAKKRGMDPDRVVAAPSQPLNIHMDRLHLADIAFDTQIVSGGATTSQALWAGLPVITMRGGHYMSRMSASMVSAVGMDELIATDIKEYEDMAVEYGLNFEKLNKVKNKLEGNLTTTPLFDGIRFVDNLETAYEEMYSKWQKGEKPKSFKVEEVASIRREVKKIKSEDRIKYLDMEKLNMKGVKLMREEKYMFAQRVFASAVVKDNKNPVSWNNLGTSLYKRKLFNNALAAAKHAVRLKPDWTQALNNMAGIYGALGKFEESIITFERVLELEPDYKKAQKGLKQAEDFLRKKSEVEVKNNEKKEA